MKNVNVLVIALCVIAVLFSLSLRIPPIFTAKVFDYEWHTATVLRHLIIWHEEGALAHGFVPPVTYEGQINKHINNHSSIQVGRLGYKDAEGSYYYVSYPPFAYIAPYVLFKVVGVEPNVIGLRLFNVATQVATAIVLFALLYRLTKNRFVGLFGFVLYMFIPISLYMHTVNYMSDMFVQFLFALSAYLFYLLVTRTEEHLPWKAYVPLGVTLALMVYTEWIGMFVCAYILLYAIAHRKHIHFVPFVVMSVCIPLCVLFGVLLQYASVANVSSFVSVMFDRYTHGYVPTEVTHPLTQLDAIVKNYAKWFGPTFLATLFLGALLFLTRTSKNLSFKQSRLLSVLGFLLVPVVLHHVVFFDWTAFHIHFYSVLKTSLFFCVLIPLLLYTIWTYTETKMWLVKACLVCMMLLLFISSLFIYASEIVTRVKKDSLEYCNLGHQIRLLSASDEVVFLQSKDESFNDIISAIIILCAERNVALYTTQEEAEELMRLNKTTKGVLYTITYDKGPIGLVDFQRIWASF